VTTEAIELLRTRVLQAREIAKEAITEYHAMHARIQEKYKIWSEATSQEEGFIYAIRELGGEIDDPKAHGFFLKPTLDALSAALTEEKN
jgi:hypothetical protein